jgi:UDP-N-acetylglucosamine pyrophosphorylase
MRLFSQQQIKRVLHLVRLPTGLGDILSTLDKTNAFNELRVVGIHSLYVHEALAAAELKVDLWA